MNRTYPPIQTTRVWREAFSGTTVRRMLPSVDPYHVLQVIPGADEEVIRAAYRALARKYHPDTGGSQTQMAVLNAAWETLGDRTERARYDSESKAAAAETTEAERHPVADPPPPATPSARRPMPSHASGTVLDFGRYAGYSIGELAAADPDYLRWLARTPIGRRLQSEIDEILASLRPSVTRTERSRSRFSRPR